jgi:signal transduction histidine kinase|tara:strand:+ start:1862 stop:3454 length:1593 start_codon:yes stop_codon:yes gene_type:complete
VNNSDSNEQQRLAALAALQIMDTPSEQAFDDLTALAARWLDTPIALISLIDSQRQWFKSRVGLNTSETPKEMAFCAHAIRQPALMEVADATLDARFAGNPLVTGDPGIRFYAGMPIASPQGTLIGTLCVIDQRPRTLNDQQRDTLQRLARLVEYQLQLRHTLLTSLEEAHELAHQQALNRRLLDSLKAGVVACADDGTLTQFNSTAQQWHGTNMLNLPPEEWARSYDLYAADGRTPLTTDDIPLVRAWQGKPVENVEICIACADQPLRHVLCSGGLLYPEQGGPGAAIVVMHDISEIRHASNMKSHFLATVSHELRTPLTAITGALGLLHSGTTDPSSAAGARLLGIARENSQRLNELINDLLDMEKLEAGKVALQLEPQDLRAAVVQAMESNRPYAERFQVHWYIPDGLADMAIIADQRRLQQVLTNYLSNAAKFSHSGGSIRIEWHLKGDSVTVSVVDQGIGIAAEQQPLLFTKFSQLDTTDKRRRGGTGLGLAICKELIERMGGQVGVQSEVDRGSCFWFTLPLAAC